MWFDSHCHLHLCDDAAPPALVAAARAAGVDGIVTIGIDVGSSRLAIEIARDNDVFASVGVHPNSSTEWDEDAKRVIEDLASDERVVAIGESGLDFYRDHAPHDVQRAAFRDHIELAKRHDKALVIHTRDSTSAALDELSDAGPPRRLIFHCWSGNRDEIERALDLNAYVSFAGNVSFASAEDLRNAARAVPDDRLLIETDSPFLTPVPHRGRPNSPANVIHVGAALADARGTDVETIAASTSTTARAVFGIA